MEVSGLKIVRLQLALFTGSPSISVTWTMSCCVSFAQYSVPPMAATCIGIPWAAACIGIPWAAACIGIPWAAGMYWMGVSRVSAAIPTIRMATIKNTSRCFQDSFIGFISFGLIQLCP